MQLHVMLFYLKMETCDYIVLSPPSGAYQYRIRHLRPAITLNETHDNYLPPNSSPSFLAIGWIWTITNYLQEEILLTAIRSKVFSV